MRAFMTREIGFLVSSACLRSPRRSWRSNHISLAGRSGGVLLPEKHLKHYPVKDLRRKSRSGPSGKTEATVGCGSGEETLVTANQFSLDFIYWAPYFPRILNFHSFEPLLYSSFLYFKEIQTYQKTELESGNGALGSELDFGQICFLQVSVSIFWKISNLCFHISEEFHVGLQIIANYANYCLRLSVI